VVIKKVGDNIGKHCVPELSAYFGNLHTWLLMLGKIESDDMLCCVLGGAGAVQRNAVIHIPSARTNRHVAQD
jgi:hypothetical protein